MADGVEKLSSLMKAWLEASPDRNMSMLHRKISKDFDVSYGTVKHAANGDHEVNFSVVLAILKVVVPTKEGRRSFIEKNYPEFMQFAKEVLEDESENEDKKPQPLSDSEARMLAKLMKRKELKRDVVRFVLGDSTYSNFVKWIRYYKLGREDGESIISSGAWVDTIDFPTTKKMVIGAIESMNPGIHDGDLIESIFAMTTKDAATKCWYIQVRAWEDCQQIVKNNSGDHEIMLANIMKYD